MEELISLKQKLDKYIGKLVQFQVANGPGTLYIQAILKNNKINEDIPMGLSYFETPTYPVNSLIVQVMNSEGKFVNIQFID